MFYVELICGVFFFALGLFMFLKPGNYSKGNNEPKKLKNVKIRGIVACVCGAIIIVLTFGSLYIDKQNSEIDKETSDLQKQKEQIKDLQESQSNN